jgi:transcription-repair coupling factor (superfamily II helicase)
VCPGARSLAVAALADGVGSLAVVVASSGDAEALAAGLDLVAPELETATLPAEAFESYFGRPLALGASASATHTLRRFAAGRAHVLVVPARALPYPLPPAESMQEGATSLRVGERVDVATLATALLRAGYRRVELVEEAGEFSMRGHVVDVGTPDRLVRAVLDYDTVETLSEFEATSQRSVGTLAEVELPPLRVFPCDGDARTRLAEWLASAGCALAAEAARLEHTPRLWEGFLGVAHPHVHLWDMTSRTVVCEPAAVAAEVERVHAALRRAREALLRDRVRLPEPDAWLVSAHECAAALAGSDRIEELSIGDGVVVRLDTRPAPLVAARPQALVEALRRGVAARATQAVVVASSGEAQRIVHLLADVDIPLARGWARPPAVSLVEGALPHGFEWPAAGLVVYGRADVTHLPAPARRPHTLATVVAAMRDLRAGDYVVHAEHGIGRFAAFRTLSFDGDVHECVELVYAGGGKLLVPLERADLLEKYAGSEGPPPRLDRLGGSTWARTKARVKKALKDMAEELLKVQAQREAAPGFAFSRDSPWQREFEGAFEYELTADQGEATRDIKRDMESQRPMDRLLVGDVGYGKTEVAMRAVFKAVMDGKQVAVLAPTTILAEQHYRTFSGRFAGFPVEIRWLSRFLSPVEQRDVVAGLAAGTVDVVIGTHRVLAKDISFRDLGVLIVDEEQRFGVAQKERLKRLKTSVDVLALSATPIPRTLNQGLVGLRDVSIIETPPRDRLAVQTHVLPFRRDIVREAVLTEMARGGQTFFVHNRVASMPAVAELLREIVPEARVVMGHGQMDERALEASMDAFLAGHADVLLATAIIENGLDIPNANTLIVNRADRFGLAQLYQLRGRVGRSDRLAFAYLLVPPEGSLSQDARDRLAAILEFAELGAGFRIAARDLEIRGAGNLLGAEQHGHLRAVGYETYCRLLEEAVRELKGEVVPAAPMAVELRLGLDLRLPETFIAEENLRLVVYRRIAAVSDEADLDRLRDELVDRFGPPPDQLDHLLLHQHLRLRAQHLGILRIRAVSGGAELTVDTAHPQAHGVALALASHGAHVAPSGVIRVPVDEGEGSVGMSLVEILPLPSES